MTVRQMTMKKVQDTGKFQNMCVGILPHTEILVNHQSQPSLLMRRAVPAEHSKSIKLLKLCVFHQITKKTIFFKIFFLLQVSGRCIF